VPSTLATDQAGHLFVTVGSHLIAVYTVDPAGPLTQIPNSPFAPERTKGYFLPRSELNFYGQACLFDDRGKSSFRHRFGEVDGNGERPVVALSIHSEMTSLLSPTLKASPF